MVVFLLQACGESAGLYDTSGSYTSAEMTCFDDTDLVAPPYLQVAFSTDWLVNEVYVEPTNLDITWRRFLSADGAESWFGEWGLPSGYSTCDALFPVDWRLITDVDGVGWDCLKLDHDAACGD